MSAAASAASASFSGAGSFITEGFRHIVPEGFDHILFICGLFFLARSIPPLIWQITAFTLGHSLTLGLSLQGIAVISPRFVEAAIGASIALVGIENLFTTGMSRWRPLVVFLFGLIHGLGFAHSFHDLAGAGQQSLIAMFSFNFGIELGQLTVLTGAILALGWAWEKPWYRRRIARPASCVIAASGIWMAVHRGLF